jgi:hypothetical protein
MFVTPTQAPILCQPSVRALHNPADGQLHITFRTLGTPDNNDLTATLPFSDKLGEPTLRISGVGIDGVNTGVDVWVELFQAGSAADAIQDVPSSENHGQNQAKAVHDQVSLPTVHLLAAVIAAGLLRTVGVCCLAIDARCCPRRGFILLPHGFIQGIMDARQRSILLPLVKVVVDGFPRGKVMGQHSPLTTAPRNIENAIDDPAEIDLPRPSSPLLGRDEGTEDFPLVVCRVCLVSFIAHASKGREMPWVWLPRRPNHPGEPPISSWFFSKQTLIAIGCKLQTLVYITAPPAWPCFLLR